MKMKKNSSYEWKTSGLRVTKKITIIQKKKGLNKNAEVNENKSK